MKIKIPVSAAHETDIAAVQLCEKRKALLGVSSIELRLRGGPHMKTPASSAGVVSIR
ncbi:hypothetical protein RvVAR031_27190 [Agrobacterium vitis]|nr:hypothetical protein RvVAR031_27190 [Agrobacterium vitis]